MKKSVCRRPVTTALLVFFLTIASSLASLPHVPKNCHAISSNGKYRLDCIAENVEGKEFKLTDLESKKVLWRQTWELMEEAKAIHLDDKGNSVIENLDFDLVFTDAKGKITGKVNLPKDGLTSKEYKTYVEDTTAGPLWGHHLATSYFLQKGEDLLFVVRHWWGRRLVVDFQEGKLIEADKELLSIFVERKKKSPLVISSGCSKTLGRMDVLKQLNVPEFAGDREWEYDIDAKDPHTLVLKWDEAGTKVLAIEKTKEPRWAIAGIRDVQVVNGKFLSLRDISTDETKLLDELAEDADDSN